MLPDKIEKNRDSLIINATLFLTEDKEVIF